MARNMKGTLIALIVGAAAMAACGPLAGDNIGQTARGGDVPAPGSVLKAAPPNPSLTRHDASKAVRIPRLMQPGQIDKVRGQHDLARKPVAQLTPRARVLRLCGDAVVMPPHDERIATTLAGAFTVDMWVRMDDATAERTLASANGLRIAIKDHVLFAEIDGKTIEAGDVSDRDWYHVALSFGEFPQMFVNGVSYPLYNDDLRKPSGQLVFGDSDSGDGSCVTMDNIRLVGRVLFGEPFLPTQGFETLDDMTFGYRFDGRLDIAADLGPNKLHGTLRAGAELVDGKI